MDTYLNWILRTEKKFDILAEIKPKNLIEENAKFLNLFSMGIEYNPKYIYDVNYLDIEKIKNEAKSILNEINDFNNPEFQLIKNKISEIEKYCNIALAVSNDDAFSSANDVLFKPVTDHEYNFAVNIINRNEVLKKNYDDKKFNSNEILDFFKNELKSISSSWDVQLCDISAKINVDSANAIVQINRSLSLSESGLNRLLVHEIWTHVLRSHNGQTSGFNMLATGTANFLETEEGLAVYSEFANGLLDFNTLKMYAGRVIAAHLSSSKSFYEIYSYLINKIPNDALHVTHRIKRGMCNTKNHGGFTKDKIYLQGFIKVNEFMKTVNQLSMISLFSGCVGLDDIHLVIDLSKRGILKKTAIVPKYFLNNNNLPIFNIH